MPRGSLQEVRGRGEVRVESSMFLLVLLLFLGRWKTRVMQDDGENSSSFYKDQFTEPRIHISSTRFRHREKRNRLFPAVGERNAFISRKKLSIIFSQGKHNATLFTSMLHVTLHRPLLLLLLLLCLLLSSSSSSLS